jgi:hypothetical protein
MPVDGEREPEQYTAWHLANTQRVSRHVTKVKVNLISC